MIFTAPVNLQDTSFIMLNIDICRGAGACVCKLRNFSLAKTEIESAFIVRVRRQCQHLGTCATFWESDDVA